jgi:hypothetical protein
MSSASLHLSTFDDLTTSTKSSGDDSTVSELSPPSSLLLSTNLTLSGRLVDEFELTAVDVDEFDV